MFFEMPGPAYRILTKSSALETRVRPESAPPAVQDLLQWFSKSAKGAVRAPRLARNRRVIGADGSSVLRAFLRRNRQVSA